MFMLSTDAYSSIKFTILGGCFLGAAITIIITNISFRKKVNFSFILALFTSVLLLCLESLHNNIKLYKYIHILINNYKNYLTIFLELWEGHIISMIGFLLFLEFLFSSCSYFLIMYPLMKLFKKEKTISPHFFKYFILFELIIHITDMIIMAIFMSKPYYYMEIMPLSDISYSDFSDELTFQIIILYFISGIVHYINYRYFLDYNEGPALE